MFVQKFFHVIYPEKMYNFILDTEQIEYVIRHRFTNKTHIPMHIMH